MRTYAVQPERPILTLAQLEEYDPYAPPGGKYRRFRCPLCRPTAVSRNKRCLGVEVETGGFRCFGCNAHGQLQEFWPARAKGRRRTLPPLIVHIPNTTPSPEEAENLKKCRERAQHIKGTPGAAYLEQRGIPDDITVAAGVWYGASWYHRPAVLFPLRNTSGELVAVNGRFLDPKADPKTMSYGPQRMGVFATPGAWESDPLVIVEAPIDALSLHVCGLPAIALIGTAPKDWLPSVAGLRRVVLALDADNAGDEASAKIGRELASFGAYVERWRPAGGKDWNELLQLHSADQLAAGLAEALLEMPDPFSVSGDVLAGVGIPPAFVDDDHSEDVDPDPDLPAADVDSPPSSPCDEVLMLAEHLRWPSRFIGGRGIHPSQSGWQEWAKTATSEDIAVALRDLRFER